MPEESTNASENTETAQDETPQNEDGQTQEVDPGTEEWDSERAMTKIKKLNAENKNLRERVKNAEESTDELGQLQTSVADLTKTNEQLETELLKYKVGYELGLPPQIVTRLSGSTREELLQDAEDLVGLFHNKQVPSNQPKDLKGGSRPGEPSKRSTADLFAETLGGLFN